MLSGFLNNVFFVFLVIVIVKISRFLTLRTIFKPTKKLVKHVKEEWKNSNEDN